MASAFNAQSDPGVVFKSFSSFPTVNAEHIANRWYKHQCCFVRGLYSANIVLIVSYLLIVQSIICYKNQKHFNQFTMSLLFCVILFYIIFLVSAAASVGTEQSTGLCALVFSLIRVRKHWWDDITQGKQ